MPGTPLGGVSDLALSPDGASLYAAGGADSTLVTFAITGGGVLRSVGCLEDADNAEFRDEEGPSPLDSCAKAPGLSSASGVAVSPDGRTVFATASGSSALTTYARDPGTGALTPAGCIEQRAILEEDGIQTEDCTPGLGLAGASDVAVAPDGVGVYVASRDSSAVAAFAASAAPASSVVRRVRGSLVVRVACPAVHSVCGGIVTVRRSARDRRGRAGRAQAAGRSRAEPISACARGASRPSRSGSHRTGARALRRHPRMAALAVTQDLSAHTAPLIRRVVVGRSTRR